MTRKVRFVYDLIVTPRPQPKSHENSQYICYYSNYINSYFFLLRNKTHKHQCREEEKFGQPTQEGKWQKFNSLKFKNETLF